MALSEYSRKQLEKRHEKDRNDAIALYLEHKPSIRQMTEILNSKKKKKDRKSRGYYYYLIKDHEQYR